MTMKAYRWILKRLVNRRKPRTAITGMVVMCDVNVCEDGYDRNFDPEWDTNQRRFAQCSVWCETHDIAQSAHVGVVSRPTSASFQQTMPIMRRKLWRMHEMDEWEPKRIHHDHYTGEPLDEHFLPTGRDDELHAMWDYDVRTEIPITGGSVRKTHHGFPTVHTQEGKVGWREWPLMSGQS